MSILILGAGLGLAMGAATAVPLCLLAGEATPAAIVAPAQPSWAGGPRPAPPVLHCESSPSIAPFGDVWISEC